MSDSTPSDPAPLYRKTDHWFQRATAALLGEVPCRLGCTSCCIGPFPITLLDVHTLQQGLACLPPDHRHRIEQRAIEQTAAMETAFPQLIRTDLLDNWPDRDIDRLVTEFHHHPCPALETDGRCGIYHHRPLVCRSMGIPTEDRGLPMAPARSKPSSRFCGSPLYSEKKKNASRWKKPLPWKRFVRPPDRQEKKYSCLTGSYPARLARHARGAGRVR